MLLVVLISLNSPRLVQQAEPAMVAVKPGLSSKWQGGIAAAMTNWEFSDDRNSEVSTAFFEDFLKLEGLILRDLFWGITSLKTAESEPSQSLQ